LVIFQEHLFSNIGYSHHSSQFSVPVDATNYIDFRFGNKVYLKLKDQYTDINYGSLRIGGFMSIPMMKELWVGFLNDYKKMSCMLLVQLLNQRPIVQVFTSNEYPQLQLFPSISKKLTILWSDKLEFD
jgi:hypothetical protein